MENVIQNIGCDYINCSIVRISMGLFCVLICTCFAVASVQLKILCYNRKNN